MSKKQQTDYTRTQVRIPQILHEELKAHAKNNNLSMNAYIEEAIHGLVAQENERDEITSKEQILALLKLRLEKLPKDDLEVIYKICSRFNYYRGDIAPLE